MLLKTDYTLSIKYKILQEKSSASYNVKKSIFVNKSADIRLFTLLKENNAFAWNCVYDRYASLMYGNILNIIKDKQKAEKIFIIAFINLKAQNIQIPLHCSLSNFLCNYAKQYAIKYLEVPIYAQS